MELYCLNEIYKIDVQAKAECIYTHAQNVTTTQNISCALTKLKKQKQKKIFAKMKRKFLS